MHAALTLSEILRVVFDFVSHPSDSSLSLEDPAFPGPEQASLSALVLTCKAFQDVALDYLWQRLPSPAPLFMLAGMELRGNEYHPPSSDLDPERLKIFLCHASRVRAIHQHNSPLCAAPALRYFASLVLQNQAFSRVHFLSWRDPETFPIILRGTPQLRHLVLSDVHRLSAIDLPATNPDSYRHLSGLQALQVSGESATSDGEPHPVVTLFDLLSYAPYIARYELRAPELSAVAIPEVAGDPLRLRSLDIHYDGRNTFVRDLQGFASRVSAVSSLNLHIAWASIGDVVGGFRLLSQRWASTLRALRIVVGNIGPHGALLGGTLLRGLSGLCELRTLDILTQAHMRLCEPDLTRFAHAWPRLRRLAIRPAYPFVEGDPGPGLSTAAPRIFAESCPEIESVEVPARSFVTWSPGRERYCRTVGGSDGEGQ